MSAERDYSHFLVLGASLIERWLLEPTYNSDEFSQGGFNWMFESPMEQSDAEAAGDLSLFGKAFPNALNVGRSGWRMKKWSEV